MLYLCPWICEILKFGRCKITKSLGKDKVSFPFFVALCAYVREREFYRTAIAEISESVTAKAFAIVCKKENGLVSAYDRYENPPMSWKGSVSYPSSLSVSDFENNYILVKLYNL